MTKPSARCVEVVCGLISIVLLLLVLPIGLLGVLVSKEASTIYVVVFVAIILALVPLGYLLEKWDTARKRYIIECFQSRIRMGQEPEFFRCIFDLNSNEAAAIRKRYYDDEELSKAAATSQIRIGVVLCTTDNNHVGPEFFYWADGVIRSHSLWDCGGTLHLKPGHVVRVTYCIRSLRTVADVSYESPIKIEVEQTGNDCL